MQFSRAIVPTAAMTLGRDPGAGGRGGPRAEDAGPAGMEGEPRHRDDPAVRVLPDREEQPPLAAGEDRLRDPGDRPTALAVRPEPLLGERLVRDDVR